MPELASVLVLRCAGFLCALPVAQVAEVFRPLPVEALGSAPAFVRGMARVRGVAVPVVELAWLLGAGSPREAQRWVALKADGRCVVLAVDEVLDVRDLDPQAMEAMPPLLAAGAPAVESLGSLDSKLLLILQAGRLVPELAA